jgi:hypothetical protein
MKLAFLYIGGIHQVFHTAAVAAEMSKTGAADIHCLYASEACKDIFQKIAASFGAKQITYSNLQLHKAWQPILRALHLPNAHKILRLHAVRHELSGFDAIITPERTSAILKNWLPPTTKLIHFKHGVGDGQKGFESRLGAFDLVFVAGEKDKQRLYSEKIVERGKCAVTGSVKLATTHRLQHGSSRATYFPNGKPIVLYNPHFNEALGSWQAWGERIVSEFLNQSDFNLIIAPHIRMFETASAAGRRQFEALSVPGRIIADSGSLASCDMSYTLAADIFMGDVSSQAYEFISVPRPCVFLNRHAVAWENDKNYAFWHFGDVVDRAEYTLPAVQAAKDRHVKYYKERQMSVAVPALGLDWSKAPERASSILLALLENNSAELVGARKFELKQERQASI